MYPNSRITQLLLVGLQILVLLLINAQGSNTLRQDYTCTNLSIYDAAFENGIDEDDFAWIESEVLVIGWLWNANSERGDWAQRGAEANWNLETDITEEHQNISSDITVQAADWEQGISAEAISTLDFNPSGYDCDSVRQLKLFSSGGSMDDSDQVKRMTDLSIRMSDLYSTTLVCFDEGYLTSNDTTTVPLPPSGPVCLTAEPDLASLMESVRDYDKLKYIWESWRDTTGPTLKDDYIEFISLQNHSAINRGYSDLSEVWLEGYEQDDFEDTVDSLWEEVRPLYLQLHAYVRRKLHEYYPDTVPDSGTIPAHILGNMWSQQWSGIYDIVKPYPDAADISLTTTLVSQGYTPVSMFETADQFYQSLGFDPLPPSFWVKSMLVKPEGRDVVCHGSAHDMYNGTDVRIKMCTEVTGMDFFTVHHEMGHCQYFLQYRDQPSIYAEGANDAFHEAVGDTMALSVLSTDHLKRIGLLDEDIDLQSDESSMNVLMNMALQKVAFLPFGLLLDKWRWGVFQGKITPDEYNDEWWRIRYEYQGIAPPEPRDSSGFDAGAKYHIPNNVPYLRYYLSYILQFQFHETLCRESGYEGDLYKCDVSENEEGAKIAGDKWRYMLSLGRSKPWWEALQSLTDSPYISATSILQYFKPLHDWLIQQNDPDNIGW